MASLMVAMTMLCVCGAVAVPVASARPEQQFPVPGGAPGAHRRAARSSRISARTGVVAASSGVVT
jgi:hypothetical protein